VAPTAAQLYALKIQKISGTILHSISARSVFS
jgi:hypothetical protein